MTLTLNALPFPAGEARLDHFRIDQEHSNAFRAWQRMGSPHHATPEQYASLAQAAELATLGPAKAVKITNNSTSLTFTLPRQAVSLLVFEWGAGAN